MSSGAVFFVQECPTCSRRVRVCVEYLGKRIQFRHCRGSFVARDPVSDLGDSELDSSLMERVDQLLAEAESGQLT
jgi:hypothetical protein